MFTQSRIGTALLGAALALVSVSLLPGCASERPSRREGPPPPPVPEMEAHATFFAGQIGVDVVLNRAGFSGGELRRAPQGEGRGRGGGRATFGGGFGGRRRGGEGPGRDAEAGGGEPAAHIVASNLPPVALYLRLTNHGAAAAEVEVTDFESELGNFVVQPAKLTVPAGGSIEADPMTSRLGVTEIQIPLTVALRENGRTESQVLSLQVKPQPAPPTAPQPAAGQT